MGLKQRNMTAALSVHTAERGLLISVQKRERADLSEFTVTKTQNSVTQVQVFNALMEQTSYTHC